jgi:hypothetical protein
MILNGDTSGSVTVTVPAVAGTNTATLPAATGTVMVSGNMPAFYVYTSASQSLSSGTATKIQFNTKATVGFDTNSYFDLATNYRFTPLVAGYYQINLNTQMLATAPTLFQLFIYKNGSSFAYQTNATPSNGNTMSVSQLIYFNGSTDYIEAYAKITAASGISVVSDQTATYFSGSMVRAV